jgi:hypothetical protein
MNQTMTPAQHTRRLIFFIPILLFLSVQDSIAGGERSGLAGVSMGRIFVATSRGISAIGTNPANLALGDRDYDVTFTLVPPFGVSFGSDFLNYEIYNDYFTGVDSVVGGEKKRVSRYLNDADKNRILTLFPEGIAETHFDVDVRAFGLTVHSNMVGSFGLSVTERIASNLDIPRDYARFAFFGLDSAGSTYDFGGTSERSWWLREYSLSYAHKIPNIPFVDDVVAGMTVKLVHGFGYVGTEHYEARFRNTITLDTTIGGIRYRHYRLDLNNSFRVLRAGTDQFTTILEGREDSSKFLPFPRPAGSGFGVDIGISGEVLKGLRVGLSITDIGSITWRQNTKERAGSGQFSITNVDSQIIEDLQDALLGVDRDIGKFSTALATALRFGGALQLDETGWTPWLYGRLLFALEYQQGFNDAPGNTTRPRAALGMEYRPFVFLPLRTGISVGGEDRFNWAMGFGFDLWNFTLDLGTENVGLLFTDNFKQFSAGVEIRIKI